MTRSDWSRLALREQLPRDSEMSSSQPATGRTNSNILMSILIAKDAEAGNSGFLFVAILRDAPCQLGDAANVVRRRTITPIDITFES